MANREAQHQGTRVPAGAGVIHVIPHDDDAAAQIIRPLVQRVRPDAPGPEAIVLTPDAESAVAIARESRGDGLAPIVPVSGEARGSRLLSRRNPAAVAGTPEVLLGLVRRSALKLDGVRTVVLAWADDMLALGEGPALELLMADVPKDAGRVLVTSRLTEGVEQLAERYLRRAHRLGTPPDGVDAVALSYVLVAPGRRGDALRLLLDDVDPPSATVFARTKRGLAEARDHLDALGYADDSSVVVTSGAADREAALVVLYEIPESAAQLSEVVGGGSRRVIALARPRDVEGLRRLAGGAIAPYTTRETADRARRREAVAREELRAELRKGIADQQLLALEPLLDEFDGLEIAAAALRLRQRDAERAAERAVAAAPTEAPVSRTAGWTRLFLTTGSRDNVRAGDLVGMITGEAGISSDRIGKIEIRENHSLVEVAADVAAQVATRINGSQVKGRRIVARPERDREERPRGDRGAGGRAPRGGQRAERVRANPRPPGAKAGTPRVEDGDEPPPSRA